MFRSSIWLGLMCLPLFCFGQSETPKEQKKHLIVLVGAAGEAEFGQQFEGWTNQLVSGTSDQCVVHVIGSQKSDDATDKEQLFATLNETAKLNPSETWIVLIGHGTFDGRLAKFNLNGPDVSATELSEQLTNINSPLVIINCASCSSPFINRLSGEGRVLLTATRDGNQYNFARFGKFICEALTDETLDLDKDGQTSLLEAFIVASASTEEFYQSENRLATEQALLEDNGDKKGTPANWFQGTRVVKQSKSGALPDGLIANQIFLLKRPGGIQLSSVKKAKRDRLERELAQLRQRKSQMTTDDYYRTIEPIMVQLSKIYVEEN